MDAEIDYESLEAIEDTRLAVPKRFRWATFNSPQLIERVPKRFVEQANDVNSLPVVLWGPAGEGKTCLGCALLRRWSKRLRRSGVYADAIDVAYARRMHPLGEGEAPAVLAAMTAGVLFLDELGAETGIDQTIEQIIRVRFSHERPTIIATPHDPAGLVARYGDGVSRRIFEGAKVIRVDSKASNSK